MINQPNALQSTTQKYLELFDITNDVIILQDGSVSMVLNSTAINFDLYSEEEQDAAIYAYAALLNSLSFPIEIVIRSQKKDVTSYLDLLKDAEVKAYNPVNKKNIREYRQFVEELVQERNVLEKKFYIIITYSALEAGIISGSTFIPGMTNKKTADTLDKTSVLEKALTNLEPRREHLIHQFARIGLFLQQLKTQELIQLFYTIYNPDTTKGIRLGTSTDYSHPLVEANIPPIDLVRSKLAPEKGESTPSQQVPTPETNSEHPSSVAIPTQAQSVPSAVVTPQVSVGVPQESPAKEDSSPLPLPIPPTPSSGGIVGTQDLNVPQTILEPNLPNAPQTPSAVPPTTTPNMQGGIKEDSFSIASSDLQPPVPPTTAPGVQT